MGNQYLNDDVLFTSPRGEKLTTLEKRGSRLALYTQDNEIYKRFKQWTQLLDAIFYSQNNKRVAVDLYFPLTAKKQLLKALRLAVSKKGVSVS